MTSYKEAYKYPFIATEILSSKNKLIVRALFGDVNEENNNILNLLNVLDNKEVLNTTLPGYINKIISSHKENELLFEKISKNNNKILNILLKYVYNDSYRDLFYLIINEAVKKDKKEYFDIYVKLFEVLLKNMNDYIELMNKNNENVEKLMEIKDGIYNIIYVLVKLAENSEELFGLIIKKLSEGEIVKNLKTNLKLIDEDGDEKENKVNNKNNINTFYCISKLSFLFTNLYNIILTKKENDKYGFNKYYLSTIFDPPYNPYELPLDYPKKENEENNESEQDTKVKEEINENTKLLIETSITYLKEIYSLFENKIETIDDISKYIISSFYNKITDILILITIIEKKDNENVVNFCNEILIDLIQLIIDYPCYSLVHNKTLKIFQYIIEYNLSIKKDKIIIYLKNYFNDKKINELINDEGVILNDKKESDSNIYLINILNLLEKQDNKKIVDYLAKTSEGLLETEKMEPGEYVPKPDEDAIIMQKKEDIHDSEAFIFTPKKVIEDSKKIMKNLKELDV